MATLWVKIDQYDMTVSGYTSNVWDATGAVTSSSNEFEVAQSATANPHYVEFTNPFTSQTFRYLSVDAPNSYYPLLWTSGNSTRSYHVREGSGATELGTVTMWIVDAAVAQTYIGDSPPDAGDTLTEIDRGEHHEVGSITYQNGVVLTFDETRDLGSVFYHDWFWVSAGFAPDGAPPPSNQITVSIADAFVTEGNPGDDTFITFPVSISAPITEGSLTVNLAAVNPANDVLKYMNAADTTADFPPASLIPRTVTFDATSGTTQTFRIPITGDVFIEADEQFAVRISAPALTSDGRIVNVTDDLAIGTIYDDDNTKPASGSAQVSWGGSFAADDATLKKLLEADLNAAVDRVAAAIGGTLPQLEIEIRKTTFFDETLAEGDTAGYAKLSAKKGGLLVPFAAYEALTGDDVNEGAPDIVIKLDFSKVPQWYSGHSRVDVPTVLTHEILHGLGFGEVLSQGAQVAPLTVWTSQVSWNDSSGAFYFTGSEAKKVAKGAIELAVEGDHNQFGGIHLKRSDLMDRSGSQPEQISALDVAILADIGFGANAPSWWKAIGKKGEVVAVVNSNDTGFMASLDDDGNWLL